MACNLRTKLSKHPTFLNGLWDQIAHHGDNPRVKLSFEHEYNLCVPWVCVEHG